MYPDNQQQQPAPVPTGIDYLYQIAPPEQAPKKRPKIIALALLLVGALLVVVILGAASSSKDSGPTPLKLAVRLQNMQTLSQDNSKRLRSTALQDTNSSLLAILTTANNSIATPLADYGIDMKKQSKNLALIEDISATEKKLDDAYLNSQLDGTYAREMLFLIEDTLLMMERLHSKTKVASLREFIETSYKDLEALKGRFEKIAAGHPAPASE